MVNDSPRLANDWMHSGQEQTFAATLQHRLIQSERLRALALLVITGLLLALVLAVTFVPGLLPSSQADHYRPTLLWMAGVWLAMMVYESLWIVALRSVQPPLLADLRYANAVVECLLPTLMIWLWAQAVGPVSSVGGVLPWLYFPLIAISPLHLQPRLSWLVGLLSACGFLWVTSTLAVDTVSPEAVFLLSATSFALKATLLLICGGVAAFVAHQLKASLLGAVKAAREFDRAVGIFGQHVSPQVAQRLINQRAELSAELRHVCVLFLDIRGFSTIASERSPHEVMEYLNALFAPMISCVNQHGGIVNKFLGDGFMAVFGAPFEDPQLHRSAVRCALALLDCVDVINQDASLPHTRVGIGIHAGPAMAGTIGNAERMEYTLLGDTVNAAARIEQETKKLGVQIIASDAVMEGLSQERAGATELGEIALRGISQPLRLYQLA